VGRGGGGQGIARVAEAITRATQESTKRGHIQPPLTAPTKRALAPRSYVVSIIYTFYVTYTTNLESAHPQNALSRPAHFMQRELRAPGQQHKP
jgi:hypothetical protein